MTGVLLGGVLSNCSFLSADASGSSGLRVLPQGYGWSLLYGSLLLGLVGGVQPWGSVFYASASFLTFAGLRFPGLRAGQLSGCGAQDIPLAPRPGPNGSPCRPRSATSLASTAAPWKANLDGELCRGPGGSQGEG